MVPSRSFFSEWSANRKVTSWTRSRPRCPLCSTGEAVACGICGDCKRQTPIILLEIVQGFGLDIPAITRRTLTLGTEGCGNCGILRRQTLFIALNCLEILAKTIPQYPQHAGQTAPTAASRTPPWPASGWECPGRRLSRG